MGTIAHNPPDDLGIKLLERCSVERGEGASSPQDSKRWLQPSFAGLEQSVMMGFYMLRKLLEAKKLSQSRGASVVRVERFRWNGKPVHRLNWHHLDRMYDLSAREKAQKSVKFLCDQFVHSYIFEPLFLEDGLDGIFVTSDRERARYLYFLSIDTIIFLFEAVGKDYPSKVSDDVESEKAGLRLYVSR
ncbi:MAG TPA: hypothetical protein VKB49_18520 [Candidatus Sulfotelmatobacter sp.]|nr:hypothetical protein [Candidatus Sulfotelmatobacter sp.]